MSSSNNQKVLTMIDYYDKPLQGVANLFGHPHMYEALPTYDQDFESFYYLKPIYDPLLSLLLEDWDIWVRYYNVTINGTVQPGDEHPCLGVDRERYNQVEKLLKKYSINISSDEVDRLIKADGKFTPSVKQRGVAKPDTVDWSNIVYGANYSVVNFLTDTRGVIKREKLNDVSFKFQDCDEE